MEIIQHGRIDRHTGPYPSYIEKGQIIGGYRNAAKGTYYGIANQDVLINDSITVKANCVFACASDGILIEGKWTTELTVIARLDYQGQDVYGVPVEQKGRLVYIDGCTDSLLIYPPKMGDPCINHLHFPAHINQTEHTHPSVRLGLVMRGQGYACGEGYELPLTEGDIFCIDIDEKHRFRTEDQSMDIIAYHPDSDWGPTDEVHPMINRTVIK